MICHPHKTILLNHSQFLYFLINHSILRQDLIIGRDSSQLTCASPSYHLTSMLNRALLNKLPSLSVRTIYLSARRLRIPSVFYILRTYLILVKHTCASFHYRIVYITIGSRGSSFSTVSDYGLDGQAIEVRSAAEAKGFFL
jgi:hypothetical protein